MIQQRKDCRGRRYEFDSSSGAVFYGEADADAFSYNDGVTWLAACGCRAADGCRCAPSIQRTDPEAVAVLVQEKRRQMAAEAAAAATSARNATPPEVVRAMVAAKREEMAAERRGNAVRHRILSQYAADAAFASEVPNGYDVAVGHAINPVGSQALYDALLSLTTTPVGEVPAPPCPYEEPLRKLRERDRMREANR